MRKVLASLSVITMFSLSATAGMAQAQTSCPPEVASAKAMLTQTAKSQDVQAPRSLAGAKQDVQAPRSQEIQAPRSQDIQAPRSLAGARQDVQAPRSQEIQAPRSQEIQAPRSQDTQAPRSQGVQAPRSAELTKAATLVQEADAACNAGNTVMASEKAKAAMQLLKK